MLTAETFHELLCEQAELLARLIESGHQQQQAIEANRMSELVAILAQKQPRLERLGAICQQLQGQRQETEPTAFWPDPDRRQQCQTLRDEASQAFERLIELEQACEQALSHSRDQIQQRLRQVETGRHAASAYLLQSHSAAPPRGDFSSIG